MSDFTLQIKAFQSNLNLFKKVIFSFQHANEDVEKMILGNKCDMEDKRAIQKEKVNIIE